MSEILSNVNRKINLARINQLNQRPSKTSFSFGKMNSRNEASPPLPTSLPIRRRRSSILSSPLESRGSKNLRNGSPRDKNSSKIFQERAAEILFQFIDKKKRIPDEKKLMSSPSITQEKIDAFFSRSENVKKLEKKFDESLIGILEYLLKRKREQKKK